MYARFFCRTGALAGAEHRIGDEATIGRGAENTIVTPAGVVSSRHARIVFDPAAGAYVLEDLHSRNGTLLDGAPVAGRVRLGGLHVITLGWQHDFIFVALPDDSTADVVEEAAADPLGPETVHGIPSMLQVPRFVDAPPAAGGLDPPGSATVLESVSVVAAPALPVESDAAEPNVGPSAPGTVLDPASAIRAPSFLDAPNAGAPDRPGTRYGPPSVVRVPPLEVESEAGANVSSGPASPPGSAPDGRDAGLSKPAVTPDPPSPRRTFPPADARPPDRRATPPLDIAIMVAVPDRSRQRFVLPAGRHVVGRNRACAIRIDDRTLSREHAAFVVRAGTVTVEDLNSQNGTFLDGRPVHAPTPVPVGRPVTFGDRITAVVITTDADVAMT